MFAEITTDDIKPVDVTTLDEWLDDPETVPTEETVYICMDGKKRRLYEETKARILERAELAEEAAKEAAEAKARAAASLNGVQDDRLSTKTPKDSVKPPAERDQEMDALERLVVDMKAKTVPFVVRSVGSPRWNELIGLHPPRKMGDTGRFDPRDQAGFNSSTFYVQLARESIVSPAMTDARYEKLLTKITDAQFDKLAGACARVNRGGDGDLPF